MSTLAVVVFAWDGSRPIYLPWHVENMRRMVAKYLTVPHKFVVITDKPENHAAEGIEVIKAWETPHHEEMKRNWINCYVRLGLFDKEIGGKIADRILAIDLDAIIRANINDLVEGPDPFRIMCMKNRTWLQGGLFRIDPGTILPNPWDQLCRNAETNILKKSERWIGSDQALMSELFYDLVQDGTIPRYSEDDGMSINDFTAPWRVFFRTGHKKCWEPCMPEFVEYCTQSERTEVPANLPTGIKSPVRAKRPTIQRVHDTNIKRAGRLRKIVL